MNLAEYENYLKSMQNKASAFAFEANRQALESVAAVPAPNMVAEVHQHATGVRVTARPVAGTIVSDAKLKGFTRSIARDINGKLPGIVKGLFR